MGETQPVSLIVTALASGAAAALKDTASQALKDLYRDLKSLLRRKLEGNKEAELALERYETKPEVCDYHWKTSSHEPVPAGTRRSRKPPRP